MGSDHGASSNGDILLFSGGSLEQMSILADRSVVIIDVEAASTTLDSSREPSPYSRGVLLPNHLPSPIEDELTVFEPGSDRDHDECATDTTSSATAAASSPPSASSSRSRNARPAASLSSASFPGCVPPGDPSYSLVFSDSNVSISEADSPLATVAPVAASTADDGSATTHRDTSALPSPNEFIFSRLLGLFRQSKAVGSTRVASPGAPLAGSAAGSSGPWLPPPLSSMLSLSPSSLSATDSTALMESESEDARVQEQPESLATTDAPGELSKPGSRPVCINVAYRHPQSLAMATGLDPTLPLHSVGSDLVFSSRCVASQCTPQNLSPTGDNKTSGQLLRFEQWSGSYSAVPSSTSPKESRPKGRHPRSRLSSYLPALLGATNDGSPKVCSDTLNGSLADRFQPPQPRRESVEQISPDPRPQCDLRDKLPEEQVGTAVERSASGVHSDGRPCQHRHALQHSPSAKSPRQSPRRLHSKVPALSPTDSIIPSQQRPPSSPYKDVHGQFPLCSSRPGVSVATSQAAADNDGCFEAYPTVVAVTNEDDGVSQKRRSRACGGPTGASASPATRRLPKESLPQVSLQRSAAWPGPSSKVRHVKPALGASEARNGRPATVSSGELKAAFEGPAGTSGTMILTDRNTLNGESEICRREDHSDGVASEPWGLRVRRLFSWSRGGSDQSSAPARHPSCSKWNHFIGGMDSSGSCASNNEKWGIHTNDVYSRQVRRPHHTHNQTEDSAPVKSKATVAPSTQEHGILKDLAPFSASDFVDPVDHQSVGSSPPRRSYTLCYSIRRHNAVPTGALRSHKGCERLGDSDSDISIDRNSSHGSCTTSHSSISSSKRVASKATDRSQRAAACSGSSKRKSKRHWTLRKLAGRSGSSGSNSSNSVSTSSPKSVPSLSPRSNSLLVFKTRFFQRCPLPTYNFPPGHPLLPSVRCPTPPSGNIPSSLDSHNSANPADIPLSNRILHRRSIDGEFSNRDEQASLFLPLSLFSRKSTTVLTENDDDCRSTPTATLREDHLETVGDLSCTLESVAPTGPMLTEQDQLVGRKQCGNEAIVEATTQDEAWTKKHGSKSCIKSSNGDLSSLRSRRGSLDSVCFDPSLVPPSPQQSQQLRIGPAIRPAVFTRTARRASTVIPASPLNGLVDWDSGVADASCKSVQEASVSSAECRQPGFLKSIPADTPDSRQPQAAAQLRGSLELSPGKLLDNRRSRTHLLIKQHARGTGAGLPRSLSTWHTHGQSSHLAKYPSETKRRGSDNVVHSESSPENHSIAHMSTFLRLDGNYSPNNPKFSRSSTGIDTSPSRRLLRVFWSPGRKHSCSSYHSPKAEPMKDTKQKSSRLFSHEYYTKEPSVTVSNGRTQQEANGACRNTFQQVASLQGHSRLISKFMNGMNVQVIVKQRFEAVLANAKLALETLVGRFSKYKTFLVLEISASSRTVRRALRIDPRRPASTARTSLQFLEKVTEADPKCAEIIAQLLSDSGNVPAVGSSTTSAPRYWSVSRHKGQQKSRRSPIFITVPVKSTSEGALVFLLRNIEERNELEAIVALLQAYDNTFSTRFEPDIEAE